MHTRRVLRAGWVSPEDCRLEDLVALVEAPTEASDYPLAVRVEQGVPVYGAAGGFDEGGERDEMRSELGRALLEGPGIVVLEGAVEPDAVEAVSERFWAIIDEQRAEGGPAGDHYAKPGANDRIWNALEKLAVADPEAFVAYYGGDAVAVAAEAWLGPGYQVTSQVNVVNPGGEAQHPHRDYHLGFTTDETAARYPRHAHLLSPALTLQGAIAHTDMPVDTGPTMYLPHSHKYELGYVAWRRPEFVEYFARRHVQLPLRIGDAVFFSPAVFHAAGHNRTGDVRRMANLLQISSPFGRATESVDRARMAKALYPTLLDWWNSGRQAAVANAVAASAEGYAFPTNLDRDQPVDGLTPPTQSDLVIQALKQTWPPTQLAKELDRHASRRRTR